MATRPTTDRVREALFSMLGDITERRFLDLYAGSGALGIEALSRGAVGVVLVESARPALACIRQNLSQLAVESEITVLPCRVERARERLALLGPFDLVFCDPPWDKLERSISDVVHVLEGLVSPSGTIVYEHPTRHPLLDLGRAAGPPLHQRSYGDTTLSFFRVRD
jgi:16S rRNA (guanine(966)-N(2))-methyltransferase RsmD